MVDKTFGALCTHSSHGLLSKEKSFIQGQSRVCKNETCMLRKVCLCPLDGEISVK